MMFPEKITSIRSTNRVLEIGPGATPHRRSDAFLELDFNTSEERIAQRGGGRTDGDFGGRPIHYYDGGRFPFDDRQFDYVICSHVIEHVPDPSAFMSEVFRVSGGRGYLEYPLITYEYLYDFDVHLHFVKFDHAQRILRYLPKQNTGFAEFAAVRAMFYKTLENGWDDLCSANKPLYFEGLEFDQPFAVELCADLSLLLPPPLAITHKRRGRKLVGRLLNKLGM